VDRCAVCDCNTVYVQKDFNRTLGVSIFLAGALLFCLSWKNRLVEGTLVGGVCPGDGLLFKFLPDVTICYKCYAQYGRLRRIPITSL